MSFIITLQDFDENTEYNVEVSEEEYNRIMSGDNELANKYLQREIERKNRLLAYQLLLNEPKTQDIQKSNPKLGVEDQENEPDNVVEPNSESHSVELEVPNNDSNFTQRWSDSETKKLIELYRNNFDKFNDRKYKAKVIYSEIAKHFDRFNSEQIETKIKNLKKTYKIVLDNSNNTGRGRITWPYFDSMQEIFGSKPKNNPLSIASNRSGFERNSVDKPCTITSDSDSETPRKILKLNSEVQSVAGASHLKESNSSQRKVATSSKTVPEPEWLKEFRAELAQQHKEKIDKQQQFLDLFKERLSKSKE